MITIRTDQGIEYARAAAAKRGCPHISVILFVTGEPAMRDYVFKSAVGR